MSAYGGDAAAEDQASGTVVKQHLARGPGREPRCLDAPFVSPDADAGNALRGAPRVALLPARGRAGRPHEDDVRRNTAPQPLHEGPELGDAGARAGAAGMR